MQGLATGFVVGMGLSLTAGRLAIPALVGLGVRQTVSEDAPESHAAKQTTPTMGGLFILLALSIAVMGMVAVRPDHGAALGLLCLILAFGLIGFLDDFLIVRRGKNLGLLARQKLALQFLFAGAFIVWLRSGEVAGRTTVLLGCDLGWAYYAAAAVYIVGFSNAINLADGLDGLAGGMSAMMAIAAGLTPFAVAQVAWLPMFGGAFAGTICGFLWWNVCRARVFMGDVGSLAIGAGLAGMAILGKQEAQFQICAAVPWVVMLSVILQVVVFKWRRARRGIEFARANRLFRKTPLHHHFELLGWPEPTVVGRFWLLTALAIAVRFAFLQ